MTHYETQPASEAVRPICAAAIDGHHAKIAFDDVPICLVCLSDYTEELTGETLAEWCRRRVIERAELNTETA